MLWTQTMVYMNYSIYFKFILLFILYALFHGYFLMNKEDSSLRPPIITHFKAWEPKTVSWHLIIFRRIVDLKCYRITKGQWSSNYSFYCRWFHVFMQKLFTRKRLRENMDLAFKIILGTEMEMYLFFRLGEHICAI